ncbi:MAG: hypothetical protein LBL13_12800 [Bacteroidales bacterium]|jgi:hypothetical protein|nr:hypothetical protein [Bacteroidales bacterium]
MDTIQIICLVIGTGVGVCGIMITAISIIVRKSEKKGRDEQRLTYLEKKMNELPCDEHDKRIAAHNNSIIEIRTSLKTPEPLVIYFSKKNSPTQLTDVAIKIYQDIKGEEFLNQHIDLLIQEIEEKKPKTALDVESYSFNVLTKLVYDDMFIDIKNILYNYPPVDIPISETENRKRIISIYEVCYILSLPLRDRYLEKYPELIPPE